MRDGQENLYKKTVNKKSKIENRGSKLLRHLIVALIVVITLAALWPLTLRLVSQLYTHAALDRMEAEAYADAASLLEKAVSVRASDPYAWKNLGRAYYHMADARPADEAYHYTEKSKRAYLAARRINLNDAEIAYGLARAEARLERMFAYPEGSPYDALPYFEDALRLRPNGILYHYALARYLHRKNDRESLSKVVAKLAFVYPPVYSYLKNEAFWSTEVRDAVRQGLALSIAEGLSLKSAHAAMSSLMADEKDLSGAVYHYEMSLAQQGAGGDAAVNLRLGDFYLEQGNRRDAETVFWRAVSLGHDREQTLNRICGIYRKNRMLDAFDAFYEKVARRFPLSRRMDIVRAQALIDQDRFAAAGEILERLNRDEPRGDAFYELYRIAEKQKDRDGMMSAIQKATIHDRADSRYHLLFSQLLARENRLEKAEREAALAVQFSRALSPGLYTHRAEIRRRRANYPGAAEDYVSAARLQPRNARLYARAAAAYEKGGNQADARNAYRKAMELDPDNRSYRDRLEAIGGRRVE